MLIVVLQLEAVFCWGAGAIPAPLPLNALHLHTKSPGQARRQR
jgi:hypothetical protein